MTTITQNINDQQKPVVPQITTPLEAKPIDWQVKTTSDVTQQANQLIQQPIEKPVQPVQPTQPVTSDNQVKTTADIMKPKQDWQITTDLTQTQPKPVETTPVKLKSWQEFQLNAQEMKMREQNLKQQEVQVQQQQKQAKIQDLNNFLAWKPTKEAVNNYLKSNYDSKYKEDYSNILRQHYKQTATTQKVQQYSVAPVDVIDEAVKTGDLIPWSDAYNSLPPEKLAEYNTYKNRKQASESLTPYVAPTADFTKIYDNIKEIFSTNYRKDFADKLKSPEITGLQTEMTNINDQIKAIDDKIQYSFTDTARKTSGVPTSMLNKLSNREIETLTREKNVLINQYNSKLGTLNMKKDDINTELEIAKVDDANLKSAYMTSLSLYQSEQSRMDAVAKANFEQQSKERAEQRANDFTEKMAKFQQDFAEQQSKQQQNFTATENQKNRDVTLNKPDHQIGRDGKMYAIVNAKAQVVMSDLWTPLFWEEKQNSDQKAYKQDDGTYAVVTTYKDWRTPTFTTMWASWQSVNGNLAINDVIAKCRVSGQCWQWANDYASNLWIGRIFWDSYESKQKYVNSNTPAVWGFAVWNPWKWIGKYAENWHVWIVQWYDANTWEVTVTDWNYGGDQKQQTHKVKLSEINYNWGFFDINKPTTDWSYNPVTTNYNETQSNILQSMWSVWSLTAEDKKTLKSYWLTAWDVANYSKNIFPTSWVSLSDITLPDKAPEAKAKALSYGIRMADSTKKILELEKTFWNQSLMGQSYQTYAPNFMKSTDQQSMEIFKKNFITASLRQESWASIAPSEFASEEIKYFPQVWDSIETIKQKQIQRETAIKVMLMQAWVDSKGNPVQNYYKPNNIEDIWKDKAPAPVKQQDLQTGSLLEEANNYVNTLPYDNYAK